MGFIYMNRSEGQLNRFFLCDHFSESHNFHHISKYVCSIHYYIWIQVNCIYLNQFLTMCVCVGGGGGLCFRDYKAKSHMDYERNSFLLCFHEWSPLPFSHDHEWQISTPHHTPHTHDMAGNLMHDTHSSARYSSVYLSPYLLTNLNL